MAWGLNKSTSPVPWATAFGTSPFLSPTGLLAFQVGMALIFGIVGASYIYDQFSSIGAYSLLYLTNWSFYIEIIYFLMLPAATYVAQKHLPAGGDQLLEEGAPDAGAKQQPGIIRFMIPFYQIVHPMSIFAVFLFWGLLLPPWKLCIFTGGADGCVPTPGFYSLFTHLYDTVLCMVSLLVGRLPIYYSGSLWFMSFVLVYLLWTIVHFLLKIGVHPNMDCQTYPLEECPIYPPADWHNPSAVIPLAAFLLLVGVPCMMSISKAITYLRGLCDKGRHADDPSSVEVAALS